MITVIFIVMVIVLIPVFVVVILFSFSKQIKADDYNKRYYKNGYHIYYDRKILKRIQKQSNNQKSKKYESNISRKTKCGS